MAKAINRITHLFSKDDVYQANTKNVVEKPFGLFVQEWANKLNQETLFKFFGQLDTQIKYEQFLQIFNKRKCFERKFLFRPQPRMLKSPIQF